MSSTYKRGSATVKVGRTPEFVESVRADIEADRRVIITLLMKRHWCGSKCMWKVLTEDLGLSKKSGRWKPKLLNKEQVQGRVDCSQAFLRRHEDERQAFLDNLVTMDEFPKVKESLAGKFMDARSFKKEWDGVTSYISKEDYATAFLKWVECYKK